MKTTAVRAQMRLDLFGQEQEHDPDAYPWAGGLVLDYFAGRPPPRPKWPHESVLQHLLHIEVVSTRARMRATTTPPLSPPRRGAGGSGVRC